MVADLHVHSTYSDGSFSPEALVKKAWQLGLKALAVADHDTVEGVEPALEAGQKYGLEVIPALEFSTFRGKAEIHILGYYVDYKDERLLGMVDKIFQARLERARKMVKLLNQQGVNITLTGVREIAGDEYIGRPHIARAMVEAGYIEEMGEAFTGDYIGNQGQAYVDKYRLKPEQAIRIIKEAGGIPVLAHPVFVNHGRSLGKADIKGLKDRGLEGLEVFHSKHNQQDTDFYLEIAREFNLLITGGSDFHGENSPGVNLGDVRLNKEYLDKLREVHYN
ncbi:MAG: PHP domain-containing protein [Bacillota bacterium]